jgi:enoyl-CoA hydratase/carnithine racemase
MRDEGRPANGRRYANLTVAEADGIGWVTIDRQLDRNSLDSGTIGELESHLDASAAAGLRAIIYRGAGETHFIGGADGVEMYRFGPDQARAFSQRIQRLFDRMETSPLLLIAAIHGLCFGGGLEFALACDLRIAAVDARLGLPEVKLGIIPGGGGTQRLPRIAGWGRAVEMILSGRLYEASEAWDRGVVHEVVAPHELESVVRTCAERAVSVPPHAFAAAKRAVYASWRASMDDGLAEEADRFAACFGEPFFADRVEEQLASGRLTTTRDTGSDRRIEGHGNA